MKPEFVARVTVTYSDETKKSGTAYPVAENLLITALHVVQCGRTARPETILIAWPAIPGQDGNKGSLECLTGQEDIIYPDNTSVLQCDVALIRCSLPDEMNRNLPWLLSPHQALMEEWDTKGYPDVCRERKDLNGLCSVSGRVERPRGDCVLELNTNTETEGSGWSGLSGAPVFSGNWLIGVISDTNPKIKRQMECVFLPYLIRKEKSFREKLRITLTTDFPAAITLLREHAGGKRACHALCCQMKLSGNAPEQVVDALKTIRPLGRMIETVHETITCHCREAATVSCLQELLLCMLPNVFDISAVEDIRKCKGNPVVDIVSIPYALDVSAEILMAGSDGRKAEIELESISASSPEEKQFRIKKYRLAPESGVSMEQWVDDMVKDLANSTGGDPGLPFVEYADEFYQRAVPNPPSTSMVRDEDGLERVRHYSRKTAEDGRTYYWIVKLPENKEYRTRWIELIRMFRTKLPHIAVLALEGDFAVEMHERDSYFDPLLNTLSFEQ